MTRTVAIKNEVTNARSPLKSMIGKRPKFLSCRIITFGWRPDSAFHSGYIMKPPLTSCIPHNSSAGVSGCKLTRIASSQTICADHLAAGYPGVGSDSRRASRGDQVESLSRVKVEPLNGLTVDQGTQKNGPAWLRDQAIDESLA